jgi:CIC family chloride channel protein
VLDLLRKLQHKLLHSYRRQLTNNESVLAYSLLGVVGGVASGLVVLAFELAISELSGLWGVGNGGEGFESLPNGHCLRYQRLAR